MLPGNIDLSSFHLRLIVFALVTAYTGGFLLWYSSTALGLAPVLDGREQLELATRIAHGTLPVEPYYRAALYPSLVAWLIEAGVTAQQLPFAARLLNGVLHLLSTALVWMLTMRVWRRSGAAALAALLFGMNPVVQHFAADPLDLTLAMTFMLGGILAGLRALTGEVVDRVALVCAALLLTSAMLARPQMLLLLPVLLGLMLARAEGRRLLHWALLPMVVLAALMGLANVQISGDFRILPWQGAYNLWAANGPDANGRYFTQREKIAVYVEGSNPARVESERLYQRDNPGAPTDYASMSRYWHQRTVDYVLSTPKAWLRLVASKAWYLLNNFEQYDIKTYDFHKARSPWLRYNPLGWSWLLAAAVAALVMHSHNRVARTIVLYALAYGSGLLLSYVSARFRLPLVPLLAVLAGGVLARVERRIMWRGALSAALVLAVSRQAMAPGEAERTFLQDHLLSARAALTLGFYDEALSDVRQALAIAPRDATARELLCVTSFNAWLRAAQFQTQGPLAQCSDAVAISPVAQRAMGILYWRQGRAHAARKLWLALVVKGGVEHDAALAALVMTQTKVTQLDNLDWRRSGEWSNELLFALTARGNGQARAIVLTRLAPAEIDRQTQALAKLFSLSPDEQPRR